MIGSTLVTLSDAALLDLVRRGDETAFTELYVRHREVAQRMAALYCRQGEADDIVDVAFEKVLGALRRGRGPTGAFRAYLFVTLRRLAAEQARRREHPFEEVPEPLATANAMPGLDSTEREMITEAFESLPGRWQAVLWHTAVEGRHPRDLAEVLGMSANAVSALAYRARERLRQAYLQAHLQAAPRPECEPHRSNLGAYVRGGQSARERQETAQHLQRCPSCQDLVAELLDVNRSLARAVVPLFLAISGSKLGALVTGGAFASEVGEVTKRSVGTWLQTGAARAVVGAVAASSAALFGLTYLEPHLDDPGSALPVLGPEVGDAVDGAEAGDQPETTLGDPVLASSAKPCDVPTAAATEAPGGTTETTATTAPGLVGSVLAPLVEALSPTTTLLPGSATLAEVACTATAPGRGDLTVVVTGPDRAGGVDTGQRGEPLLEGLPVEASVAIDLSDGARVAVEAGLPEGCDVATDRQSLTCSLDALLPGAPTEATVGLEVEALRGSAPSATVTLSSGEAPVVSQTLDLSPVTGLLTPTTTPG